MCSFKLMFDGTWFQPGAGIAPTHGGFLMCGKNAEIGTENHGYFSVSKSYIHRDRLLGFTVFYMKFLFEFRLQLMNILVLLLGKQTILCSQRHMYDHSKLF